MKIIKLLTDKDLNLVNILLSKESKEFNEFKKLGWNFNNIVNHFKKENNFSIGCFNKNKLCGLLLGEKIINNLYFDLEIHIMFVNKKDRRNKIGSSLLNFIQINKNLNKIVKIYLEVSENNTNAIKFYEKNNFVFFKFRHNYYKDINIKNSARCYSKNI